MKLALVFQESRARERELKECWKRGAVALGFSITGMQVADTIVTWGPRPEFLPIYDDFLARGKRVLCMDFGYWGKHPGHEYYKITINGIHPPPPALRETLPPERYLALQPPAIMPWREGGKHILIAGMGLKGCIAYRMGHLAWDRQAVETLRRSSKRELWYRKKPSFKGNVVMPGARLVDAKIPISEQMKTAYAVVTHHGASALQALAMGIPVFVHTGIFTALAEQDLTRIEQPKHPDNREQFFWNLAHWQWTKEEIAAGLPLISYQERGFL